MQRRCGPASDPGPCLPQPQPEGSPVVGLGQLVGHGHEGQSPVLLRAQHVVDAAPVDQAPFLALHEGLHEDVVLILSVQAESLQHSKAVGERGSPAAGGRGRTWGCTEGESIMYAGNGYGAEGSGGWSRLLGVRDGKACRKPAIHQPSPVSERRTPQRKPGSWRQRTALHPTPMSLDTRSWESTQNHL